MIQETNTPRAQTLPWYFVLVPVVTLLVGGLIGYGLGLRQAEPNIVTVVVTATPAAVAQAAAPSPTPATAVNGPTPTIMEFLLADARHFQGNADAPVTIIEFSDFK